MYSEAGGALECRVLASSTSRRPRRHCPTHPICASSPPPPWPEESPRHRQSTSLPARTAGSVRSLSLTCFPGPLLSLTRSLSLGIVLTRILALRDDTIVFAGARNPSESSDLLTLAGRFPKKVQLITFIPGDRESNIKTVNDIRRSAGRLDVVIANAGAS